MTFFKRLAGFKRPLSWYILFFYPTMSAIDHLSKIWCVEASEMKECWYFNCQMFRKALVCRRVLSFQLKILLFGKWRDEVVQIQSTRIRKATLCKTLTYLERTESPLSPKVSITTICDLCLLLRLPDRRGYFPLLCGSWLQFFYFSSFRTNYVDHSTKTVTADAKNRDSRILLNSKWVMLSFCHIFRTI